MHIPPRHSWKLTPKEAIALQSRLASSVIADRPLAECRLIAGADVSHRRFSPIFYASVVVLDTCDWSVVEARHVVGKSVFPYVPGLLSFREAPILLRAFAKLKHRPDAVILDGQGTAHPRRLGLAAHVGLWLGMPTIGCAKTRLCGEHRQPGRRVGAETPLVFREEVIGSVVRTKRNSKPLYVSPGNMIDMASAVRLVLACCQGYRLPEPTRQAHLHVNEFRRAREAVAKNG